MTPNAADLLAARINEGYKRWIAERREKPKNAKSNRASSIGHPCLRHLVYLRTHGDQRAPVDDTLQAIFREGEEHEVDVKRILREIGIDLFGAQHEFPENTYELTGHNDVFATREGRVGCEIKSVNPNWYKRINTAGDLLGLGEIPRKWYYQAQSYIFLDDAIAWVLILKNKLTGELKAVVIPVDWQVCQEISDKADSINRHIKNGTLPDYHSDYEVCLRCPFRKGICSPPLDYGEGAQLVTDQNALEALEDYWRFWEHGQQWKAVDAYLKDVFKGRTSIEEGQQVFMAGDTTVLVNVKNGRKYVTFHKEETG